jgi:transcriptional regulator of arginine metabolism
MSKKNIRIRHEAIKELIKSHPIEDQETLVELIKKKYGIDTNQSIVSRDLRQLGVSKHQVNNRMIYELKEYDASREILRLAIIEVDHNESLVVIKTLPGLADFVGDYLDMQEELPILGNIAGENTIFVAPRAKTSISTLYKQICQVLYFKEL